MKEADNGPSWSHLAQAYLGVQFAEQVWEMPLAHRPMNAKWVEQNIRSETSILIHVSGPFLHPIWGKQNFAL